MRAPLTRIAVALVIGLIATTPLLQAGADERVGASSADAAALRELLEDERGTRASWATAPELVVLTSVMAYGAAEASTGYTATTSALSSDEAAQLAHDLSQTLGQLTAGRLPEFSAVRFERVSPGTSTRIFRRGQIVVGRFTGLRRETGTLGFGGRTVRDGLITSGAVMLDQEYDMESPERGNVRAHELGHAIGFNHVESRRSLMNSRVSTHITEFDRSAIALVAARQF